MSRLPLIGTRACNPQGAHLANHVDGRALVSSAFMPGVGLLQILPFIAKPIHYSCQADRPVTVRNRLHSLATLPFIRAAVASGEPVSAIGFCFAQVHAVFAGHESCRVHETRRYTTTFFSA